MVRLEETKLPGVGVRHDFASQYGKRVGVITHRDGRREIFVSRQDDPDACAQSITLTEEEAEAVADLLGGSTITRRLATLPQDIEGLAMDWVPLPPTSRFLRCPMGDAQLRSRTGTSIVAVMRDGQAHPAPDPQFVLLAGDTLVLVGTPDGVLAASRHLGSS
ncbi:cation:proton antiporter regulatory subunit [Deinococcus peraridilitoris]|uniref:Putative regulatory ligand binding protein, C-terminal domain of K+ channels like protein n=1 Tax=Deinococcus peraridilitoris (strain DSM 19664 / LMG 22246 / CIP 109416 / KR-200) TaxID=937777 RepID=K9ZXA6_DEIPD|nr:cation:proton antiporter regulatory subunit [Deinococcus peraridilitoris]AFZ66201.1 putative regulatory ligand binding protein, C-terminal domain of K+ channels like protein [Deinococcus peraridilitoris DSM 19664]